MMLFAWGTPLVVDVPILGGRAVPGCRRGAAPAVRLHDLDELAISTFAVGRTAVAGFRLPAATLQFHALQCSQCAGRTFTGMPFAHQAQTGLWGFRSGLRGVAALLAFRHWPSLEQFHCAQC